MASLLLFSNLDTLQAFADKSKALPDFAISATSRLISTSPQLSTFLLTPNTRISPPRNTSAKVPQNLHQLLLHINIRLYHPRTAVLYHNSPGCGCCGPVNLEPLFAYQTPLHIDLATFWPHEIRLPLMFPDRKAGGVSCLRSATTMKQLAFKRYPLITTYPMGRQGALSIKRFCRRRKSSCSWTCFATEVESAAYYD